MSSINAIIKKLQKYNPNSEIQILENRINIVIHSREFSVPNEDFYEKFYHWHMGEKHFELKYALGNIWCKLIISKGIELFSVLGDTVDRYQVVDSSVNIDFPVRRIYSEEDRRTKMIPEGCEEYEKEVWVVRQNAVISH